MDANGNDITVGVYRNNLAVGGTAFSNRNAANDANNSWSIAGITASDADFQGVSEVGLDAPRRADGSLPVLTNFHLAAGSDAIDRGVDQQLPFAGTAPDLGAFETGLEPAPVLPPDGDPAAPTTPADPGTPGAGAGTGTPGAETPTYGVGGAQGDTGSGDDGSTPVAAAGAPGSAAGAAGSSGSVAAPGDDAPSAGLASDDSGASDGCACTLPSRNLHGASACLGLAALALGGLSRRAARRRR
jgi:hypothetical protein